MLLDNLLEAHLCRMGIFDQKAKTRMHEELNAECYVELCIIITGAKDLPSSGIGDLMLKMIMNRLKGFGNQPMRTVRDMQKCLCATAEVQLLFIYSTAAAP